MLQIINASIFDSPAQTLVNTVNTVGVMGKGIAKEYKKRYPQMFKEYKHLCETRKMEIGSLHIWRGNRWVLNFPTKTTWKKPSKIEYVEDGLKTFVQWYARMGIRSISFPPLGCGNGNLCWDEVKPLMLRYLLNLDISVYIHDWQVSSEFQPEHGGKIAKAAPVSYDEFKSDLYAIIDEKKHRFKTFGDQIPYCIEFQNDDKLSVFLSDQHVLDEEFLSIAWVNLNVGILTRDSFGGGMASELAKYLLPVIATLQYVHTNEIQLHPNKPETATYGLYFYEVPSGYDEINMVQDSQQCLFH